MAAGGSKASHLVRQTFRQTWDDFFLWRPKITRALDASYLLSVDSSDRVIDMYTTLMDSVADIARSHSHSHPKNFLPLSTAAPRSSQKMYRWPSSQSKTAVKEPVVCLVGSYVLSDKPKTLPPYFCCVFSRETRTAYEEQSCTFLPLFTDNQVTFDEDAYLDLYDGRTTSSVPGRDATGA